jgi:hypothetical protein
MIDSVQSNILDNMSIYDNFDIHKPDVFITHLGQLTKDVIFYLLNEKTNVKLLINIDNIPDDSINKVGDSLAGQGINFHMFGSEAKEINHKYIHLMPGADIFLNSLMHKKIFNVPQLIFVDDATQIDKSEGISRHYTTTIPSLEKNVDFIVSIFDLNRLFVNYDEIVFCGSSYVGTQLCFDAIYSGTKVIFDTKDNTTLDKIDSIFKKQKLLTAVKNKHTCLHRTKQILSQVSLHNLAEKLAKTIEEL